MMIPTLIAVSFLAAALVAARVAHLKGRTWGTVAGIGAVVAPPTVYGFGRWQVERLEGDGLVTLGMAMGYGYLIVAVALVLLGVSIVGAALPAKLESPWSDRQREASSVQDPAPILVTPVQRHETDSENVTACHSISRPRGVVV